MQDERFKTPCEEHPQQAPVVLLPHIPTETERNGGLMRSMDEGEWARG